MAPPRKTVEQYEAEATRVGDCLIHPSSDNVPRKIYQLRWGLDLPSHIAVCHTCDTPGCIQDGHLWPGTWKENVDDAVAKGRHSCFAICAKPGEPFRGGPHSDEVKKAIGKSSKERWADPEYKKRVTNKIRKAYGLPPI